MKIIQMDEVAKESFLSPLFTGSDVTRQPLTADSINYSMNVITFGKGVRNKLHTHESDQVLIVTSGTGIIATETEQHTVTPGHVALIHAGERHWHGATEDSTFAHISLTLVDSKTTQLEE
jgi:quercetin dioxygenase-like cupin family protein